jgi:hypothetical protein
MLDLGTGTGVLAISAAKALHGEVLASDIDPLSVRVARDNARLRLGSKSDGRSRGGFSAAIGKREQRSVAGEYSRQSRCGKWQRRWCGIWRHRRWLFSRACCRIDKA